MQSNRPYVISIAGFDPTAGAGILADIKTLEQTGVYGLGVCSAITFQTEDQVLGVSWIPLHQIELQFDLLMKRYPVQFIKIGLIQSIEVLDEFVQSVVKKYPETKIIWDPILKASAGFQFHQHVNESLLYEVLSQLYLLTPNSAEAMKLIQADEPLKAAEALSRFCNVFMKSFEDRNHSYDVLISNGKTEMLKTELITEQEKHGSGCVVSSVIAAYLAKGSDLLSACEHAKEYTSQFLASAEGLLGYHKNIQLKQQHA